MKPAKRPSRWVSDGPNLNIRPLIGTKAVDHVTKGETSRAIRDIMDGKTVADVRTVPRGDAAKPAVILDAVISCRRRPSAPHACRVRWIVADSWSRAARWRAVVRNICAADPFGPSPQRWRHLSRRRRPEVQLREGAGQGRTVDMSDRRLGRGEPELERCRRVGRRRAPDAVGAGRLAEGDRRSPVSAETRLMSTLAPSTGRLVGVPLTTPRHPPVQDDFGLRRDGDAGGLAAGAESCIGRSGRRRPEPTPFAMVDLAE
jgi:hypothetical protein